MPGPSFRSFLPAVVVGSLLTLTPVALAAPAHAAGYTQYRPTCDTSTYGVPAGVTLLNVTVYGEPGNAGTPGAYSAGAGGRGGKVEVTLPVTPGQVLWAAPNSKIMRGGGEYSYGIGGNGSLVTNIDPAPYCATGTTLPKDAILVAAGGGGGGADGDTGTGGSGGDAGAYGGNGGHNDKKDGAGGAPGSQTAGGGGGNNGSYPFARSGQVGQQGSYLLGGHGGYDGGFDSAYPGAAPVTQMNAGGGGGGFYGGGGGGGAAAGAAAGGGGGGSNYVSSIVPTTAPTEIAQAGVRFNGAASDRVEPRVDFVPVYTSRTSAIRTPLNPIHEGNPVSLSVTVTRNDGGFPQGGTVEFLDGDKAIATGQVDASTGVASVSVSNLSAGTHLIQARFLGAKLWMQQVETSWAENPNNQPLRLVIDPAFRPVAPVVTKDPVGSPKLYSSSGHFDAEATGNPTPAAQWQQSPNAGRNWVDIPGATDRQLVTPGAVAKNGYLYRAVFTNGTGIAITKPAMMTVLKEPMPVVPVDASMYPGSEVPALTATYPFTHPPFGRSVREEVTKAPKCTTTATSQSPVGTYPITCSGGVMPNYDPDYRTGTLTIAAHSHATSFTVPHAAHGWYRGDWIHLTARGGEADNPVEFSIDHGTPAGLCEVHGSMLVLTANLTHTDDCLVTAKQPGVSHAPPVTRAVRINVPHRNAMLLAPATGAVGETAALTAHGYRLVGETSTQTADVEVTRRHHDSAVCTVSKVDGVVLVHYLAVGHCTVHAQQPHQDGRAGGTSETIAVHLPKEQTITFGTAFPSAPQAGTTLTVTATGTGSATPVVVGSETTDICSFKGSTLYLLKRGTCVVAATKAGGGGYAATVLRQTITVAVNDRIVFFPPESGRAGQVITLTATKVPFGRPPVSFSSKTTGICTVSGAALTLRTAGACIVVATQPYAGEFPGSRVERTITVTP
ncbi:Ig-like domain repeat protein [Nocardioides sp. CN2-186]|uniref:Ig-like domain repeat protein n=1 Tax=Nocardioides tweenelious TaxID=3156607 RepID=UPI0032B5E705